MLRDSNVSLSSDRSRLKLSNLQRQNLLQLSRRPRPLPRLKKMPSEPRKRTLRT